MSNSEEPRRQLRFALGDLEAAMEETSWEVGWYLDLETGRVVAVDAETRRELEAIYEDTPDSGGGEPADFARVLEQRDLPPWMMETIIEADLVERGFGDRFIPVPRTDSREAYRDMEDFVSTLQDARLRDRLSRTIQGRGAFGRFRDVIAESPRERERWFEFKNRRVRDRIVEWLESEGIEAILDARVEPEPVAPEPPVRAMLIAEALAFAQAASRLPGVIRIALLGSLTTPEPDPKDADLLVTVADDVDLAPLAALGRRLKGRAQNRNRGADIFLADPAGNYLGRTCPCLELSKRPATALVASTNALLIALNEAAMRSPSLSSQDFSFDSGASDFSGPGAGSEERSAMNSQLTQSTGQEASSPGGESGFSS